MLPVELIYDEDQSVVPVKAQLELVSGHLCNARMFLLYCITFLLRISPENFWGGALDPNWTNWRKFGTRCVIELHNSEQRQTGKVSKVKYMDTAVCSLTCHTAAGTHVPHGITQCYLPPDGGDIPAFTRAEAGTRLSDLVWMQGWVDLVGLLHTEMVYPPEDGHPSKY